MGHHTAKAGLYIDDSYKPQSAGRPRHRQLPRHRELRQRRQQPARLRFRVRERRAWHLLLLPAGHRFLEGNYVYRNTEWYLQDNWKVNGKLTLDYGLRFVHQPPQYHTYRFS